jgi:hypothetical protein
VTEIALFNLSHDFVDFGYIHRARRNAIPTLNNTFARNFNQCDSLGIARLESNSSPGGNVQSLPIRQLSIKV